MNEDVKAIYINLLDNFSITGRVDAAMAPISLWNNILYNQLTKHIQRLNNTLTHPMCKILYHSGKKTPKTP